MFDGIVTLEDTEIPVVVRFDATVLQLLSNGTEVGEWAPGEYAIDPVGDGVYSITAENESLVFVPSQPELFARGLTAEMTGSGHLETPTVGRHMATTVEAPVVSAPSLPETSATSPLVLVGFYALAAVTVGLGIWAAYQMFF